MPSSRYYITSFLGKFNFLRTNVIILGSGKTGQKIYNLLNANRYIGLNPVLFFDKSADKKNRKCQGYHVLTMLVIILKFNAEYGI